MLQMRRSDAATEKTVFMYISINVDFQNGLSSKTLLLDPLEKVG